MSRKVRVPLKSGVRIWPGTLMEFKYGTYHPPGTTGGYHVDPTPFIFVFYDDMMHAIQGVNINYLPTPYLMRLIAIINRFPGLKTINGGKLLYQVVKRTGSQALELGYRKYLRKVIREVVYHEVQYEAMKPPKLL